MNDPAGKDDADRKKRVRRNATLLFLVAAAFYFTFIVMSVVRSRHGG